MQIVGIRFPSVALDSDSPVFEASIVFDVKRVPEGRRNSGAVKPLEVKVSGELSASSAAFSAAASDVSSRTRTAATVLWDVPTTEVLHADLVTPNLAEIVREIIGLDGWTSGSAITILFEHSRGGGARWLETESTNNGIQTPRLSITGQPRSPVSAHDPWAFLRHPQMKQKWRFRNLKKPQRKK